jgi:hypothetical protein
VLSLAGKHPCRLIIWQNSVYPLKFQRVFNLNHKVSKLAVYSPEVSKSGNLNFSLKFSIKMDGN